MYPRPSHIVSPFPSIRIQRIFFVAHFLCEGHKIFDSALFVSKGGVGLRGKLGLGWVGHGKWRSRLRSEDWIGEGGNGVINNLAGLRQKKKGTANNKMGR